MQNKTIKRYITAKTANQKEYVRAIVENDITICSGVSGTGKTAVALGVALEHMFRLDKPQLKLYVTRPMVATSTRDFPYIKGTMEEKLRPYYCAILNILEGFLGKRDLSHYIENETIILSPVELMRGCTFSDCYVVSTESQNLTVPQAVMLVTRLGQNCKMVIEGDTDQKDIKEYDGLSYLKSRLEKYPDICGCVEMDSSDIIRHPTIAKILSKLDYKGLQQTYGPLDTK